MASPLAKLWASLGLDTSGFDKGIKDTQTKTQAFASNFKDEFKKGIGLGAGFTAGAKAATLMMDAGQAAIQFVGDAISLASDWEEANSKVGVVFGDMAEDIRAFSKTASTSMGMSEREALDAIGTFGNFTQALGISQQAAVDMSKEMVQLAADIGSFNNVASDEVLLALRSGLSGEAEPMRRFSVSISAARVEANILAKGIARTKDEITDAMKVAERYAIIMDDTAMAQGDFARTGDGFANTMKTINAQLEEAQTSIGQALLPVVRDLAIVFRDVVVPAIVAATNSLKDLSAPIKDIVDAYNGLKDTAEDATGRDLTNDFANFVRIAGTGGAVLAIDSLDDVQRGLQRASEGADIFAATGVDAFGKVSDGIGELQDIANASLGSLGDMVVTPPDIADPIEEEMAKAVKQIGIGFGNIKAALERTPSFISDEDRERNMQRRIGIFRARAAAARRAGDSRSQRFYEEGLASQEIRLRRFTGEQKDLATATAEVVGRQAKNGADKAIRESRRISREMKALDFVRVGRGMMTELATGIIEGTERAVNAASLAAAAIAAAFTGAPIGATVGSGPLGGGITIAGNVYGGAAGLRQLEDDITRARRPTRRHRD